MSRSAGGLFDAVLNPAQNILTQSVDVRVYALRDQYSEADRLAWRPINPVLVNSHGPRAVGLAPYLHSKLRQGNHDVLHLHGIWLMISRAVAKWKRETRKPLIISPHGMLDPWALKNSAWKKKIVGHAFEYANLRGADCLHALNTSEAEAIRAFGLTNPIAIIPNGSNLPELIGDMRKRDGRHKMLFLGRIHPKKGLLELIRAWASFSQQAPGIFADWELVIAGWDDGGHLYDLEAEIKKLRISDSVRIHGPVFGAAKEELLRTVDAFILPSFSEGLPMTVLEAWSYKLPVFMTRECNLSTGFASGAAIEISTNPGEMAKAIADTIGGGQLNRLGAAGRRLVEEKYMWTQIAAQHADTYKWLRGRSGKPEHVVLD
ncbi:glycosyltransferase [Henriciella algicola]|nr:glycosyltransferase [Henriciella algicola]